MDLEHGGAGGSVGKADVDSLFKSSSDGGVQIPGNVRGTKHLKQKHNLAMSKLKTLSKAAVRPVFTRSTVELQTIITALSDVLE